MFEKVLNTCPKCLAWLHFNYMTVINFNDCQAKCSVQFWNYVLLKNVHISLYYISTVLANPCLNFIWKSFISLEVYFCFLANILIISQKSYDHHDFFCLDIFIGSKSPTWTLLVISRFSELKVTYLFNSSISHQGSHPAKI